MILGVAIIPGSLLLVGIVLLLIGLRGRRRGDHLHCRACAFDLTGLADDATACPECGHNIAAPHGRVRGVRVKSRWLIVAGVVLLLIGGVLFAQRAMHLNLYRYAPNLLLVQMLHDKPARQEAATRITNGELTAFPAQQAVARALAVQGDTSIKWDSTWGVIIEEAGAKGLVSAEHTRQYAEQAGVFGLQVRPQVQAGRAVFCYVTSDIQQRRVGPNTKIDVKVRGVSMTANGKDVPLAKWLKNRIATFTWQNGGSSGGMSHVTVQSTAPLGTVNVALTVQPDFTVTAGAWSPPQLTGAAHTMTGACEVVDHTTGSYVTDGGASLKQRAANAWVWIGKPPQGTDVYLMFGARQDDALNNPDIWLRIDGRWVDAARWSCRSSWGLYDAREHQQYQESEGLDLNRIRNEHPAVTHVDLLARPNIKRAVTSPSPDKPIWLGEWLFRDVPLDATPIDRTYMPHDENQPLESLVPAEARPLTLEEADQPPQ